VKVRVRSGGGNGEIGKCRHAETKTLRNGERRAAGGYEKESQIMELAI
jgi:hypothetical protein